MAKKSKRTEVAQSVRFDVFRRDDFRCVYCGAPSSPSTQLHCDHVVAVANGGGNEMSNLVTACSNCNYGKGVKTVTAIPARIVSEGELLVGMYGHRLGDDGSIVNQFQVQTSSAGKAAIQLFSFLDGSATSIEVVDESELYGSGYKLYTTQASFKMAYWRDKERRGQLCGKTAEDAYHMSEMITNARRNAA